MSLKKSNIKPSGYMLPASGYMLPTQRSPTAEMYL